MVEWYFDGCITHSGTYELSTCNVEIGRYTPGDTCIPRLYLDTDFQFDTTLHHDDLPSFVPGSRLDGTSIAPTSMPQQVRLVAVAPKGVSGNVKFEFLPGSVSKFPGKAMNYPVGGADVSADVYFMKPVDPKKPNGPKEITTDPVWAPLSNGIAMTTLYVNDYAAWATVQATIPTGRTTTAPPVWIRIPQDIDGNKLPDAGWKALPWPGESNLSEVLSGQITFPEEDADSKPLGPAQSGDGLSAYEEYRGFVAGGNHIRLNPTVRDLFMDADQTLDLRMLSLLPFNLIQIGAGESSSGMVERNTVTEIPGGEKSCTIQRVRPIVNPNRIGVPGSRSLGQRAIRLIDQREVPPLIMADTGVLYEVPFVNIAGVTYPETFVDFSVLNSSQNVGEGGTPNETAFVELYAVYFENTGISTSDFASQHDVAGNVTTDCAAFGNQPNCDDFLWDPEWSMIVPHPRDGGTYYKLNTVLDTENHPGDYYTKISRWHEPPPSCTDGPDRKLFPEEFQSLLWLSVLHEAAHALTLHHSSECHTIMYGPGSGQYRYSLLNDYPLPTEFSVAETGAMKTWEP